MKVTLINPPLVGQRNDPFGSIPSMPIGIAYIAAYLRAKGLDVSVIDAFGEKPSQIVTFLDRFAMRGLSVHETMDRVPQDTDLIGISVHSGASHSVSLQLARAAKVKFDVPVVVGGYHATAIPDEFIDGGADFVVLGEGEEPLLELVEQLRHGAHAAEIDGVATRQQREGRARIVQDLDSLPFPAMDLLPLQNYWDLGYAHGVTNGRYLFLISSRGCPFECRFCASPTFSGRNWRSRSARSVVDELEHHSRTYDVQTFHIQDPNFSINKERVKEICREILDRGLDLNWSLPTGIKLEALDEETLRSMKQAGCTYYSFAPESGSQRVLESMNKPVDLEYMRQLTRAADRLGIKKHACIILGYPGETDEDVADTKRYLKDLVRCGLDEVSLYIFSPLPGAAEYDREKYKFELYEELCWSPRWRPDYRKLNWLRVRMYLDFFLMKLLYHPGRILRNIYNIIFRKYELKGEMTIVRTLKTLILALPFFRARKVHSP